MRSYLICGTPRTGSTLLCSLLDSTCIAGHPESYFRRPDQGEWAGRWGITVGSDGAVDYGDYVRAAAKAGSTDNGVFGGRVMWGTLAEMVDNLGAVYPALAGRDLDLLSQAFGRLRFVYLWRRDLLAQAVSWVRAEQTGFWQAGDTCSKDPHFDAERIDRQVATIVEHNAAWRAWFASFGVRPHEVVYEDLTADVGGVTRAVLDFLGLDPAAGHAIVAGHRRQADQLNADWIARYRRGQCRSA